MKKVLSLIVLVVSVGAMASGQSIHFSQYYNAPLLTNPANTALLPDDDFRLGMNYRTQWTVVPVPYNTFSAFGDCKVYGKNPNKNNWLGLGLAFFDDKAGDGNLSLTQIQGSVAYHLQTSEHTMLSLGFSGAYVERSVNYSTLTFDMQWDGATFNTQYANGEKLGVVKTSYYTVASGLNFSIFPTDNLYIKIGGAVANLNEPNESFYNDKNTLAYRPVGDIDVLIKTGPVLIINPSVYYATQSGASELVFGSLFRTILGENQQHLPTQLIFGVFDRLGDAAIGVAGVQVASVQFLASYDFTLSALSPYNASYGALEFSLIYTRKYDKGDGIKKSFSCPRFF